MMTDRASQTAAVEALERARVAAMVAADTDALDRLLHEDLLFGHTDGHVDSKGTYLAKFRAGAVRYFDADHRIEAVRVFGDAALVNYRLAMRAELASGSRQLNVAALTVWALEQGQWRMVAHQPTVVAA
ncbi:nuclear transport factor 2 family protein [Roseomonas elaeocarpi]|uniref:Nuclear transport factor 2 family protein n=1 Tax=Roseomonas elaeocarpi TaxID=907779 RepID=A0ABV6JX35_9PROT